MYKKYNLGTFFLLIILFLAGVIGLIAYGWRRNAPMQVFENNGKRYHAAFKQKGVDVYSPYYENEASAKLEPRRSLNILDKDGVDFPEKGLIDSIGNPGTSSHGSNPSSISNPAVNHPQTTMGNNNNSNQNTSK
jgi:hypothetical protein